MQNETFRLNVNEAYDLDADLSSLQGMDLIRIAENQFHLIRDGISYRVAVESIEEREKVVRLKVNDNSYRIKIADHYDLLIKNMGLSANVTHKVSEVRAPMPGLVLSILIQPGQEVAQGDPLIILEAMKMENVIKSPGEGKVKHIAAIQGKAVDKGEVLIEME